MKEAEVNVKGERERRSKEEKGGRKKRSQRLLSLRQWKGRENDSESRVNELHYITCVYHTAQASLTLSAPADDRQ